jgi:hypothetical protein
MLGELVNIPTETLIDGVCVILAGEIVLTTNDVAELEQIQRQLQRRANATAGFEKRTDGTERHYAPV